MNISEDTLMVWAKPPSETEEDRCRNVVQMVRGVIQERFGNAVTVILQGSYKNRTNVKKESDVDIIVRHDGYFFPGLYFLSDAQKATYNATAISSAYTYQDFRNDVTEALVDLFGSDQIEVKNKCIRIKENTYRVNADVIPCFVHKRMQSPYIVSEEGIEFETQSGMRVISYPEQHHLSGEKKNGLTRQMYKPVVRILKNTRNILIEKGKISEDLMPSFFVESVVWNVLPHTTFHTNIHGDATKDVLLTVYTDMKNEQIVSQYKEVSGLKLLFISNPHKTRAHVQEFANHVWEYIGF